MTTFRAKTFPLDTAIAPVDVIVTFDPDGYANGKTRTITVTEGESIRNAIFLFYGPKPMARITSIKEIYPTVPYEPARPGEAEAYKGDNT